MLKITEFAGKKGKYFFGTVKIGERGQIVIPQKARWIFKIKAKDDVHFFGHLDKGLGLTNDLGIFEKELKDNDQYYGIAKVSERGQVVIPQAARELFQLKSGNLILVFGDISKGLGFIKATKLKNLAIKLFQAFGNNIEVNQNEDVDLDNLN